jgi:hypothetical protein
MISKFPWAFTNSGKLVEQACSAFLAASQKKVWIIQVTSSKRSGLNGVSSEVRHYVVDWFSPSELEVLG